MQFKARFTAVQVFDLHPLTLFTEMDGHVVVPTSVCMLFFTGDPSLKNFHQFQFAEHIQDTFGKLILCRNDPSICTAQRDEIDVAVLPSA